MRITADQAAASQAEQSNSAVAATVTLARTARVLEAMLESVLFDGSSVLLQFETRGQAFDVINEARAAIKATQQLLAEARTC